VVSTRAGVSVCWLLVVLAMPPAQAQGFVWAKQLSASTEDAAWPRGVAVDANGHVYTVGRFHGSVDFDPGPGTFNLAAVDSWDVFISKLDSAGNFVWAKRLGGSLVESASGVAVDASGNVYTVGVFEETADFDPGPGRFPLTSLGQSDVFISNLDGDGNFVWAKQFGGLESVGASHLALDADGNIYTVGSFENTADFDPGPGFFLLTPLGSWDAFISKLDSAGNFVWARQLGGTGLSSASCVAVDPGGDIYTVGRFQQRIDLDPGPGYFVLVSGGIDDIFISKLDSEGDFVWAKQMGGWSQETPSAVALDPGGNIYTVGVFEGTADFDPGPGTFNLTPQGRQDVFISKLHTAGNFVWAKQLSGSSSEWAFDMAVDVSGNVYTVGQFRETTDFDPGPGTFDLTAAGFDDGYISKLDSAGNFVWAGRLGGTGNDEVNRVVLHNGSIYAVGSFRGSADLDPGPGTYVLDSGTWTQTYVLKLSACGGFIDTRAYGRLLFPPLCTRDASELPGGPGEPQIYDSTTARMHRGVADTFYLSSHGTSFRPLVVDEEVNVNGVDSGLGPYDYQPGVPPFVHGTPIENNLAPLPAYDITSLIPLGPSPVLFEFVDTQREIYGNTAVYLVRDCGIYLDATAINWVSHDVDVVGLQSNLDVVSGLISELRADQDFSRACGLGSFIDTTQAVDQRPDPSPGDGYYYLVSGTCASDIGFGDSSLVPDPRDALVAPPTCP